MGFSQARILEYIAISFSSISIYMYINKSVHFFFNEERLCMLNHCEYVLFLDYGSLICDTDQEVSAFHGHVSPSAALQKPCLPPVQENKVLCNQGEKPCFLYSEYERGTDQKVPAWVCFRSPWQVCPSTRANFLPPSPLLSGALETVCYYVNSQGHSEGAKFIPI